MLLKVITVKSITYNELWNLEIGKKIFDIKNLLSIAVVANNFVFITCSEVLKLETRNKIFFIYKKFVIDNSSCKEMLIKYKYFCFIDYYLLINSEIFLIYAGNIITVKSITCNELWKLEIGKKKFFLI